MKKTLLLCMLAAMTASAQQPFKFEGSYVGDTYYNMHGGLGIGGGFMGMGNIRMGINTEKWWNGGRFFVNGASIHGKSLSESYLGDMQVASNIDAGEYAYLHEMWFSQHLGRVRLTVGLQDMNADFMVSEGGGEFLNSSFGVPPVLATGARVAIFPATGLGVSAVWNISKDWTVQAALFDGRQTDFDDRNSHNVHWCLSKADGALSMVEVHWRERLKAGAFYHTAERNYGFYLLADQPLSERVSLFGQFAFAPKSKNENNYSMGAGVNFHVAEQHNLGLAFTTAGLHTTDDKHETAVEGFYRYTLNDNISLQPDLQYIIDPSGSRLLKNDFVGIVRLKIEF